MNESAKVSAKFAKFMDTDLRKIKDARKQFERLTNELDTAYAKNADASKHKQALCDDMERQISGIKKSFNHSTLEYICHLKSFYTVRTRAVLDIVQLFTGSLKLYYKSAHEAVLSKSVELDQCAKNLEALDPSIMSSTSATNATTNTTTSPLESIDLKRNLINVNLFC